MGWPPAIDRSISLDGWHTFAVCINFERLSDRDVFVSRSVRALCLKIVSADNVAAFQIPYIYDDSSLWISIDLMAKSTNPFAWSHRPRSNSGFFKEL